MTIKVMSFSMHWQSVAEKDITADQESRANFSHRSYTHQHLSLARMRLKKNTETTTVTTTGATLKTAIDFVKACMSKGKSILHVNQSATGCL